MELQDQLHATLKEMMKAIDTGEGEAIVASVGKIDEIGHCLGADAPPMLRHYLEKRSYAKALDFLEGRDGAAAPNC
ncbi:MAG: hypothetical protein QGH25_09315 [Candidatus Latescibacteria bacterium]|nr:hypothetical protein [Candidatus Latescibacterota bacterium]